DARDSVGPARRARRRRAGRGLPCLRRGRLHYRPDAFGLRRTDHGMSVVQRDPALHERLARLAHSARMVFVAGLTGTGKSLVIHQLVHLAVASVRTVHLLQWDVVRPLFEASHAGQRYPVVDGVTQPMIRKAVGLWARQAVAAWHRRCPTPDQLLIAETPLVGRRLIEFVQRLRDDAEPLLAAPSSRFAIAVPSVE